MSSTTKPKPVYQYSVMKYSTYLETLIRKHCAGQDDYYLYRKRHRLNDLANSLQGGGKQLVQLALYYLKQHLAIEENDKHRLSDHAFVRVLSRVCGLDVKELKDKALEELTRNRSSNHVIERDNKIVTVYRKY